MSGNTIECPCGTVLRGADEDAVVAEALAHAKSVHDMDLTDDQARAMARPT
jgi:predicted small metal-binding protein